ncbi:MAG: tRNA 2-thiouridine(34) synthase MnmA [Chloroflexi bacterium HGW-Chloroflexi-3]|nr:MAG: tRNA 2-thiouridine(34) synthase MnmA [Chloroflexi bacterium HGW-Chloroflexi-3]
MTEKKPTILVAVSGGVDSSVVAAMLAEQGYPIIGVMLHLWSEAGKECENKCCTPQSMEEARKSAQTIGYPFHVIDAAEIFRKQIVQYFLDEYGKGKTPNPCVVCNKDIKWGLLFDKLDEFGADYLATGHYVRLENDGKSNARVFRAKDIQKDQSYVMSMLTQKELKRTMFPLGNLLKTEVRELARHYGLPMAEKKDSQDLCFVSDDNYKDFLLRNAPDIAQPGTIMDRQGNRLGQHQGLAFYTIGQRKGIRIAAPEPLYVLEKNATENILVVGSADDLNQKMIMVKEVNWINGEIPPSSIEAEVKIRYKADYQQAEITPQNQAKVVIQFDKPVRDATPGQYAVFYKGDELLGGGEIENTIL